MPPYKHTQPGYLIIIACGLGILFVGFLMVVTKKTSPTAFFTQLVVEIILVFCVVLFSSLTIEVDEEQVEAQFGPGPGIIRKTFPLSEIKSCAKVHIPWYYGAGIRWVPATGWMFNVSSGHAVKLIRKNGRAFLLGTDEPDTLCQTIMSRLERENS
jgi:hypothetical protein